MAMARWTAARTRMTTVTAIGTTAGVNPAQTSAPTTATTAAQTRPAASPRRVRQATSPRRSPGAGPPRACPPSAYLSVPPPVSGVCQRGLRTAVSLAAGKTVRTTSARGPATARTPGSRTTGTTAAASSTPFTTCSPGQTHAQPGSPLAAPRRSAACAWLSRRYCFSHWYSNRAGTSSSQNGRCAVRYVWSCWHRQRSAFAP
jgi:hypothetical protein